ncbi:hypothetical protein K458DRAFT_478928 [Lentithecium fluviatile CBS 122367]|uniref:Apple domain-containing protein n=1 Tax=Lentithecium fluviatile CBS 122367 TaxID=1168545 RepID=A0A6G1IX65_9PLEO|nr:hypothetical protein K458DRAFT_478928 [Lentithecium fluviatile CBS 122367]
MANTAHLTSTLCGLVAAAPKPQHQNMNIGAIDDLSTSTALGPELAATTTPAVTYVPEVAASSAAAAIPTDPPTAEKRSTITRDACAVQPGGAGPIPGDGSVDAYLAADSHSSGYTLSFSNLQGSTQQIGFLTYRTIDSSDYDVEACKDFCDSENATLASTPTPRAPAPLPITNVKCSLYGYPVAEKSATNTGQWHGPEDSNGEAFHVVIAGSNGYSKNKVPTALDDFTGPTSLPAAINAPLDNGYDTYNGMKLYNEGPFDPSICAAACQAQTAFDKEHLVAADGTYKPCNFFTAYIPTLNEAPQGTYCSFYTREWDSSYATNTGYLWQDDVYRVKATVAYTLTELDFGVVSALAPTES